MPTNANEGAPKPPALMDVDPPMDAMDDTDSYDSDFESVEDDPPDYQSVQQKLHLLPKLPVSTPGPENTIQSDDNCVVSWQISAAPPFSKSSQVCHQPKEFKDFATCGQRSCDQKLKSWQGLPTSAGPSSNNRCPVGLTIFGNYHS
jgi:hypothetical protein